MGPLTTSRRVEFRDTDAAGIVHFSAFFFWMESVEHELLRSAGVAVVERGSDGIDASWPRVSASCDYLAPIRFGDEVTVSAGVERVGGASVTYRFAFTHDGRPVANGRMVAVRCLMRPSSGPEATQIPDDIRSRLERFLSPG